MLGHSKVIQKLYHYLSERTESKDKTCVIKSPKIKHSKVIQKFHHYLSEWTVSKDKTRVKTLKNDAEITSLFT